MCPLHIFSGLVPSIPQCELLFGYLNTTTLVLPSLQRVQLMNILIHLQMAVMRGIFILVRTITCKYLKVILYTNFNIKINIKLSCLGNKYLNKDFFFLKKILGKPGTMMYNQIGSGTFLKTVTLCHIKLFSIYFCKKNIQGK